MNHSKQLSSSSSSEPIGRKAERQSPDRECEESRCRDVPQADNARAAGGPAANTPSEIVERLRTWTHSVHAVPVSDIMDEAADEIERLRSAYATAIHCLADGGERLRLTDAEREAVAVAMHRCDGPEFRTLRGLLERLGGGR